jgi:hypothetical protein
MKLITNIALAYTLTVTSAGSAYAASESRLATQALHCAAIFSVFAETLNEDETLAKAFTRGVAIFTEVYVREREGERALALREAEQERKSLLTQFREQLTQREPYLREDGVVCGAWADGFFAQGDDWRFVPVYPKVIGMGARQKYTPIGEEAFKRWKK